MAVDVTAVRERVAALRAGLPAVNVAEAARDVVILASSSRGGSSIFAEVLRQSRSLLHFRAEVNPQLRLYGCAGTEDDSVPADHPIPPGLGAALGADCGQPTDRLDDDAAVAAFAAEIAARLCLQWPELPIEDDRVLHDVRAVLQSLQAEAGWAPGHFADAQAFYARLFARLRQSWPAIHPGAYDLDRRHIAELGPLAPFHPLGPIEEPPFVLTLPWRHATTEELARRPLIVKTPGNVYRLAFLRRLFPNARVRVLHLTRNAAASINGLYDGWRYPGFHSHRLGNDDPPLQIRGYSDERPGGHRWWKFDRPPGWAAYAREPLERVCAFQWISAHKAVLTDAPADRFQLRFEDVMGSAPRQARAMEALGEWLGVPVHDELCTTLATALPVVMATEQPRHRRWFSRIDMLGPLCAEPQVRDVMERLGYAEDPEGWE